jgi:TolA-binding protein
MCSAALDRSNIQFDSDGIPRQKRSAPVCSTCGGANVEPDYAAPLCGPCRESLAARPIPIGILIAAGVVVICMLCAFVQFPKALRVGIAYDRAQRFEAAGNYVNAEKNYQQVVTAYPDSTDTLAHLGLAAYHAGDYDVAADAFNKIGQNELDNDVADQVNAAITDLNNKAAAQQDPNAPASGAPATNAPATNGAGSDAPASN